MSKIVVRGGSKLSGKVKVSGAKNAVLPVIAASILGSTGESVIHEAPPLDDVMTISEVMRALGVRLDYSGETIRINAEHISCCDAPYDAVRKMRASFLVMGPLLTRCGEARIPLPGGCAIGTRPIDQHLKGFEAMGAEISLGQGFIEAKVEGRLRGAKIYLDVPSVGATENIMMAAALAEGTTIIENAAREPEIVDLANYLNAMGGKVRGAGTGVIRIQGVACMQGAVHTVIPDRVEAGTYMIAAAITGGEVYVEGAIEDHLKPVISKLQEMGVTIEPDENGIHVSVNRPLVGVDVKTLPHPGFPTDMQAQMMALLLVSEGTSIVTETVFENRFMHVDELRNLNAQIKVEGRSAIISGRSKLKGGKVCATDLRAGAAMILAGLAADGETEVSGVHHIDRGYVGIAEKLARLGATIYRLNEQPEAKPKQVAKAQEEEASEFPILPIQTGFARA
ncbi:UDP-N-acetylglucosamine 1-carboxyvinyltransferase [Xylanibacillus composti]|uniref:UDP-N-acetylglucosamine 1-carboxyvinyltransferase n=1 Tax=Xylanibacillus composti TaxID=1572762 RepID=A0A8J4H6X8_9BACL|nr:UDP-N-acetylglucosamine 1-carboxyvinyltransferase [Xylanibacillus composti]MDT9725974.1 UDP-N-acetylglucosamine 1-carboxyvinyltransferase [Xylanibacillus composti]GIQ70872.1 UDP-N-acetylglucosamine 1-carboxyvinyltransferase 1 [Xylanibacillus composti]